MFVSKGDEGVETIRSFALSLIDFEGGDFHALCRVRERLAPLGLQPQCYGACRNLVLSGMCLSMALGGKGYLARLGQPTTKSDLVDIFAAGPNMDLASVAEQAEFKTKWQQSLGRNAESRPYST